MFNFTNRQAIAFFLAILAIAGIVILGAYWLVKSVLAPHDPTDPLARAGGLNQQQKNK